MRRTYGDFACTGRGGSISEKTENWVNNAIGVVGVQACPH